MPTIPAFFNRLFHPGQRPAALAGSAQASSAATARLSAGLMETDNTFYTGPNMKSLYRSRYDYDRRTILATCLSLWRTNAIARRIVKLMSMFVVGEGITLASDHKATNDYLQTWWKHPLNQVGRKCIPWMEEAVRAGNLFFLCTADQNNGMLYVRAVPADQVDEILTAENDVDQELAYKPVDPLKDPWPAYDTSNQQPYFMLHYAFNQLVGVPWGEPDLAPMIDWLNWYSEWLEDRVRLNKYRNAYMYVVNGNFADQAQKDARQREIAMHPPMPGTVLVANETEKWSIINPQLESSEAGEDGLALKKMIAVGAGMPVHYFAEPESSTKTTAEAAGTPTFRGLEQTQMIFLGILEELALTAVLYRKQFDRRVNPTAKIEATGPDITEQDNSLLALAASRIYPPFAELFDRGGIDEKELLRVTYRMAGEVLPSDPVPSMQKRPLKPAIHESPRSQPAARSGKAKPGENGTDEAQTPEENP